MGPREHLNNYLKKVSSTPFKWGEHDCLTFTNDAYHAMYGVGWADDWLGRYMQNNCPMRYKELRKEFKFFDLIDAIDDRLKRIDFIPPLGALVVTKKKNSWITGYAMGISNGRKGVFLSRSGIIFLSFEHINHAWMRA
jgi:hypothetical protein